MTTLHAVEERLGACIFIPPKSNQVSYGLLQALNVQGKRGKAEFSAMNLGVSKQFLEEMMPAKLPELDKLLASTQRSAPEEFAESIRLFDAKNGSLGSKIQQFFKAKVEAENRSDSGYALAMGKMEMASIPPTVHTQSFLEDCLPVFCDYSSEIQSVFKRTPTRFSGDVEYGLAFVTTSIVGLVHVHKVKRFHAGLTLKTKGLETDGTAMIDALENENFIGRGTVGVHVHFFHLVKTKINPTIRIKNQFPIRTSDDKQLQHVVGTMASKIRRRIIDPKPPASRVLVMAESYESSGNYQQDISTLEELADEEVGFQRDDESMQNQYTASLRVVGETSNDGEDPPGALGGTYTRSNNVLYTSSMEDLKRIYKTIEERGTIGIQGKVVDAIKPAIKGEILNSLPIMYKTELSGVPLNGDIPGWVLRAEQGSKLLLLWGVSGLNDCSGIVTAYDQNDWHVRESIEYIKKENTALIEELKLEGFFQLRSDEADPEEIDQQQVENGSIVLMGRHVLALKHFNGFDETEGVGVAELSQGFLESGSVLDSASGLSDHSAPVSFPETSDAAGIRPVVSNAGVDNSRPQKKPRN